MKTYEKAFIADLKVLDEFNITPTYNEAGEPRVDGFIEAVKKHRKLAQLVTAFTKEDPVVGNDLLHRGEMSPFWKDCGRPIFNVTPELAAALIMSDLPSNMENIKAPFPALLVSIQVPTGKNTPLVIDGEDYFGMAFFRTSRQDLHGGESCMDAWSVWAFPRTEPEQSHYQRISNPTEHLHAWVEMYPGSVTMHRLLVNLFAYIGAKREAKQLPNSKKAKLGSRKGTRVTKLGGEVKLPYNLIYAARGNKDPQYKLNKRFVVTGHWRNQPYGPKGDKKIKRIWIMPCWKGPDILEATERTYTVK